MAEGRSRVLAVTVFTEVEATFTVQRDPAVGYAATCRRAGNLYPGIQCETCAAATLDEAIAAAAISAGLKVSQ